MAIGVIDRFGWLACRSMSAPRWYHCVSHRGREEVDQFFEYFKSCKPGTVGLVAAGGFDPRSCVIARLLSKAHQNAVAVIIREERPSPASALLDRAEHHVKELTTHFPQHSIIKVEILDQNNAVVGGRKMITALQSLHTQGKLGWKDVVIDTSALSIGISFPLIRYFLELARRGEGPTNVHVCMAGDAMLDEKIEPLASDRMSYVHSFDGGLSLHAASRAAKLWLPQLAKGPRRKAILDTVFRSLAPDDVLPILPFPSKNPRYADDLIADFTEELESTWEVGEGDVVYADASDPLDMYRTLMRMHDYNGKVYAQTGGFAMILSPIGSKALALGTMMAAYERDLAVAYVESIGFDGSNLPPASGSTDASELVHLWLAGEVYP